MLTRRRFLAGLIPGLALLSGGMTYIGYRQGLCPLASKGFCEGPCSALIDGNGDILCDRIAARPQEPAALPALKTQPTAEAVEEQTIEHPTPVPQPTWAPQPQVRTLCPFGLINDRYPGRCRRYIDRDGNGVCDFSEPERAQ